MDPKRRNAAYRTKIEEQREKRLSNIRKGMKRIRENCAEEERTYINNEVLSRIITLRNHQSADQREVEYRRNKEGMIKLRKKRVVTIRNFAGENLHARFRGGRRRPFQKLADYETEGLPPERIIECSRVGAAGVS
ncbi:hypothetical protein EVAR_48672_1 [Eumeta japonica]|uniref:Uncharacterized protein n=1 Tax=Eumeta variegata TaxID=151549 RepID=A0A4C1XBB7_EUMVA|nr:hypothetical protein EVAR_48672_1 [Eumeta japonica]